MNDDVGDYFASRSVSLVADMLCLRGHGVLPPVAEAEIGETRLADVVLFNTAILPPRKFQYTAL